MKPAAKLHGFSMLAIAAGVIAAYHGTLACPFIFDDISNIVERPAIAMTRLNAASVGAVLENGQLTNRWAANLSFALNHYIGGFDSMRGWHLVNIAIHLLTGWLVYALGVLTLRQLDRNEDAADRRLGQKSIACTAAAAAVLWVLHPVQIQSVTYIVQRMTSMATMFFLAALCLYIVGRQATSRRRRGICFVLVPLAWLLALASKEIAITLPLVIVIYEWFFFQRLSRDWIARRLGFCIIPFAVIIVVGIIFLPDEPLRPLVEGYKSRDFNMAQRVMTEWRVIVFYLSLLLLPLPQRLNLDHHCELISQSIFAPPSTVLSLLFILGLLAGAGVAARRYPLPAFCVLWFFINLALESTIINLELVFEHRMYLPTVGIMIGVAWTFRRHVPTVAAVRWAVAAGVAALLCIATIERNRAWTSNERMWTDCAEKSPKKSRSQNNLGKYLASKGDLENSLTRLQQALDNRPDYPEAHSNIMGVYRQLGNYDKAIEHGREAVRLKHDFSSAHYNLGIAYRRADRLDEAVHHYLIAHELDPGDVKVLNNLAAALRMAGKLHDALTYIDKALAIDPGFEMARKNRTDILQRLEFQEFAGRLQSFLDDGALEKAMAWCDKALEEDPGFKAAQVARGRVRRQVRNRRLAHAKAMLDAGKSSDAVAAFTEHLRHYPNHAEAHAQAAMALQRTGESAAAVGRFRKALDLGLPSPAGAYNSLGTALLSLNRLPEAEAALKKAIAAAPDLAEAHNNLGACVGQQQRLPEALEHFKEALRLRPGYEDARRNLSHVEEILND
ncbi:MAG: tetratricopeptide repeat protein [Lentisphaeria bacterium]|jgi:tetratricopeptide (TPR) repeat protein|nr:tetratricopeptide repeat protein [Lentisphaeria bacterium]